MRVRSILAVVTFGAAVLSHAATAADPAPAASAETANPFLFTGAEYDPETGLYYMKARYYDPATGRFITEDPVAGQAASPPSLHKYLYGYANPTVYTDPSGRYAEAGHYYTPYYVALSIGMTPEEARTFAFYSQVPDELSSLDAVSNEIAAGLETTRSLATGRAPQSARNTRDVNQQSIHALTGSNAELERSRAFQAIVDAPTLAAAGVVSHRLGDTSAHRQLDAPSTLYPTGVGHGLAGTAPDIIQRRPDLYLEYVESLASALKARCGDRCKGRSTADIVETLKLATELPPGMKMPDQYDLAGQAKLERWAEGQVRSLLKLESDWRVASGKRALDLSFRPEEHDVPPAGPKTLQDLILEMRAKGEMQPGDSKRINERELGAAVAYANQRYEQEQTGQQGSSDTAGGSASRTGVVGEKPSGPGATVRPEEEKKSNPPPN